MKIKDLPEDTYLDGIKVKTTKGQVGYWRSQWAKGVWLSETRAGTSNIRPAFVEDLKETLEWEIIDEDKIKEER